MDRQRFLPALSPRVPAIALVAVVAPFVASGQRVADGDPPPSSAAVAVSPLGVETSRVFVANRGKLVGAFSGFAWVAGAEGVRIDTPNPCNEHGCFRGVDGILCARGTVAAASCDAAPRPEGRCGSEAWAVKIGLDVRRDGAPWGGDARSYVSMDYRGTLHPRLAAHLHGDGPQEYCVPDYSSGELVRAERFHAECWKEGGEALGSFEGVDKFTLEVPASHEAAAFDYCITAIHVAGPIDAGAEPSAGKLR
jgi:hypothetical protein